MNKNVSEKVENQDWWENPPVDGRLDDLTIIFAKKGTLYYPYEQPPPKGSFILKPVKEYPKQ